MKAQGMSPSAEADGPALWKKFEADPEFKSYCERYNEANASSSLAQLTRPAKKESFREARKFFSRFQEAGEPDEAKREVPVFIITEGMGNRADRNFYSRALLEKSVPLFDGLKAYADHRTKTEEAERPEGSIRNLVGFYHSPRVVEVDGKSRIAAKLKISEGPAFDWVWSLVKEAAAYSKKYPEKDFVGISIHGYGDSHEEKDASGEVLNMVDSFSALESADIVTNPGAGGRVGAPGLMESVRALLREGINHAGGNNMKDALAKHLEALKAMKAEMDKKPDMAKEYGEAMSGLIASAEAMAKEGEPAPAAPAAPKKDETPAPASEPKTEAEKFSASEERYKSGKMSEAEKSLFEALVNERAASRIKANSDMVEKHLSESGLPEHFCADLRALCLGKSEDDVKKLVEARKKIVESITGERASGAGSGNGGGAPAAKTKLAEAVAKAGLPIKA
jgi:hypothetical protein